MPLSRFSRRVVVLVGLGVMLPALVLATLGIHLTLRISQSVENDTVRYNRYLAQQVVEAYERELLSHLKHSITLAENAARNDAPRRELMDALNAGTGEFAGSHFVPIEELDGYSLLIVESQPLIYAPGEGPTRGLFFTGLLLRDGEGQVMGAGGWWINPRSFLAGHVDDVMRERLPSNPRMYGGYESIRRLSIAIAAPDGSVIGQVRDPGSEAPSREPFAGPFEGYSAAVAVTHDAPLAWARRFLSIEMGFIGVMGLVIVAATVFGLHYLIRQLELAQLKSGFVSNVTHELKTPIALIRLAVETLELGRVRNDQEREQFIRAIGRETLRLSHLVDNILDFARLEAGQRVFRFEDVDLVAVVNDTVESFRPRLDHQGFRTEVEVPDGLPHVRGDATAITHCLLNLLDNAMKYSRERREIRVTAVPRGKMVAVSVTDHGIGIPAADQKRVFEKFVRVETGLVHDIKGAGLGLSLVDQIVRAHGGRVELYSTPGEGSTFTLVLPAAESAAAGAGVEPQERTGS